MSDQRESELCDACESDAGIVTRLCHECWVEGCRGYVASKLPRASSVWQPIANAPSGTMLLLCDMNAQEARNWCFVDWVVQGKLCANPSRKPPTHWMNLPNPPTAEDSRV